MIIQVFKTHCEDCGEEVEHKIGVMSGGNEIIVDFMSEMDFECECGCTTYLEIDKYTM